MKKLQKAILIALTLFICGLSYAQNGQREWKLVATIPEDSIAQAQFLFTDPLHGYLWGMTTSFTLSYKYDILYRTVDGGSSWQKIDFHNVFGADTLIYDMGYSERLDLGMFVAPPNIVMFSNAESWQSNHDTLAFYWSENNGDSWGRYRTQPVTSRRRYMIEAVPHDHQIIAMNVNNFTGYNSGKFGISLTSGASFDDAETRWDSTLLKNLAQGGFGSVGKFTNVNNHAFDYFDDTTWIITIADSNNAEIPDTTRPFSLVTLLSRDAGHSWQAYRNIIPHFPSMNVANFFTLQCVRGTPYVYQFSGSSEGGDAYSGSSQYGFPDYGVNYLYSSDFGMTWKENTSFSTNRRGYEPVAPGEMWCTVTPHDSAYQGTPASWIAHTVNNGETWNIDSTSLFNDGYYDARIVSFSGKNNGWIYAQLPDRKQIAIFKYIGTDGVTINSNYFRGPVAANVIPYTIYPNPASNETTILFTNNYQISNIVLFDVLGRKWECPYEISGTSMAHLQTDGLRTGCYLARVIVQNGGYMVPFMVQR